MLQNLRTVIWTPYKKVHLKISTAATLFSSQPTTTPLGHFLSCPKKMHVPRWKQSTLLKVKCLLRSGSISWMKQGISSSVQCFLVQYPFTNLTAMNRDFPFCWHTGGEQTHTKKQQQPKKEPDNTKTTSAGGKEIKEIARSLNPAHKLC